MRSTGTTAQIDDLQVRAAESERPWYRNVQTLVAVFALPLSLATTLTSAYWARTQEDAAEARIRQQEIQDAKTELHGLLQWAIAKAETLVPRVMPLRGKNRRSGGLA